MVDKKTVLAVDKIDGYKDIQILLIDGGFPDSAK
jgi:hypothetical protein